MQHLRVQAPGAVGAYVAVGAAARSLPSDPAVSAFAEQFAVDVSVIDDEQRAAFLAVTGGEVFAVAQQVYVGDVWPRVRAVLDAVLGAEEWPGAEPVEAELWPLLDDFMKAVARLDALDPVTTELVRLRGARQHECRVCSSRRSMAALAAGADEGTFAAVDRWPSSDLPAPAKAALGLVDAMLWTPYDVPAVVVEDARRHLSDAEVTEGVQLFTTDAEGNLSTLPA